MLTTTQNPILLANKGIQPFSGTILPIKITVRVKGEVTHDHEEAEAYTPRHFLLFVIEYLRGGGVGGGGNI